MLFFYFAVACSDIRALAVGWYPQDYEPPEVLSIDVQLPVTLTAVATGLEQPTEIRFPKHHPEKMVVLQKEGQAIVLHKQSDGTYGEPAPFFSIDVNDRSEQGLLGMAMHPNYLKNGTFYVHASPARGSRRGEISEWQFEPQAEKWLAVKKRVVLDVEQPYGNHNGGQLQFGMDGMLYIGMGDGGWRDDPHANGQNTTSLLGSMLRIDVSPDYSQPYRIPKDNPFVGKDGIKPEIWAYGLRNPWRFTLEGETMIVADVGQNKYEEVSLARAGDNLGWNVLEAEFCFIDPECKSDGTRLPIWSYDHSLGTSITGGYVLRDGSRLDGWYVFGDFNSGRVWGFPYVDELPKTVTPVLLLQTASLIVTFGRDVVGKGYVVDFASGTVFRIDSD